MVILLVLYQLLEVFESGLALLDSTTYVQGESRSFLFYLVS